MLYYYIILYTILYIISTLNPLTIGVITYLLSGVNHQVEESWASTRPRTKELVLYFKDLTFGGTEVLPKYG